MATSKKKSAKTSSRKPSATSPPGAGKRKKPPAPVSSPAKPPSNRRADELAAAFERIQILEEDRDNQAAIAEVLSIERDQLQEDLNAATRRLREIERQAQQPPPGAAPAAEPIAEQEEDEFDHEGVGPDADLDDVETLYERMDDPRVRRGELDRERLDREDEAGDEPFWMTCPKCGGTLEEVEADQVKIDRCESCGGLWFDTGEVEMLLDAGRGPDGMRRIRTILNI